MCVPTFAIGGQNDEYIALERSLAARVCGTPGRVIRKANFTHRIRLRPDRPMASYQTKPSSDSVQCPHTQGEHSWTTKPPGQ